MIGDGLWDVFNNYHMGVTAENLVTKYNLSREEQDRFAADSQNKTEKTQKENSFSGEIAPVAIPQRNYILVCCVCDKLCDEAGKCFARERAPVENNISFTCTDHVLYALLIGDLLAVDFPTSASIQGGLQI